MNPDLVNFRTFSFFWGIWFVSMIGGYALSAYLARRGKLIVTEYLELYGLQDIEVRLKLTDSDRYAFGYEVSYRTFDDVRHYTRCRVQPPFLGNGEVYWLDAPPMTADGRLPFTVDSGLIRDHPDLQSFSAKDTYIRRLMDENRRLRGELAERYTDPERPRPAD